MLSRYELVVGLFSLFLSPQIAIVDPIDEIGESRMDGAFGPIDYDFRTVNQFIQRVPEVFVVNGHIVTSIWRGDKLPQRLLVSPGRGVQLVTY